ncbi:hypothetical protein AGLY_000863 [Aphis glycines]|uniref:Uncharacterized protein n=1 Tax=Aphis glycines TaxID=307491 RepID=A0A6G0U983_APHGL|nr:hypothetical protein AGLY_000863 [Aphis glycines]
MGILVIIYLAIKCVVITILHQPPTFTSESNINFIPNNNRTRQWRRAHMGCEAIASFLKWVVYTSKYILGLVSVIGLYIIKSDSYMISTLKTSLVCSRLLSQKVPHGILTPIYYRKFTSAETPLGCEMPKDNARRSVLGLLRLTSILWYWFLRKCKPKIHINMPAIRNFTFQEKLQIQIKPIIRMFSNNTLPNSKYETERNYVCSLQAYKPKNKPLYRFRSEGHEILCLHFIVVAVFPILCIQSTYRLVNSGGSGGSGRSMVGRELSAGAVITAVVAVWSAGAVMTAQAAEATSTAAAAVAIEGGEDDDLFLVVAAATA